MLDVAGEIRRRLHEAKERVKIADLWREFGCEGEPRKTCFCPFHKNTRTPAFSVFDDGRRGNVTSDAGKAAWLTFWRRQRDLATQRHVRRF